MLTSAIYAPVIRAKNSVITIAIILAVDRRRRIFIVHASLTPITPLTNGTIIKIFTSVKNANIISAADTVVAIVIKNTFYVIRRIGWRLNCAG
jgi:hypothetical protein